MDRRVPWKPVLTGWSNSSQATASSPRRPRSLQLEEVCRKDSRQSLPRFPLDSEISIRDQGTHRNFLEVQAKRALWLSGLWSRARFKPLALAGRTRQAL